MRRLFARASVYGAGLAFGLLGLPPSAHAATLSVGPGKKFSTPCEAVAAAQDGDLIEIDASGQYGGDVCQIGKNSLTLRGVNGRAQIDAQAKNAAGKGIWVISGHDTTVENLEFSGATVPDQNGAAIRQEGENLTVRHCYFHDNENGILTGASAQSQILIEYSEFSRNGFGDGYSHNMYIGNVQRFTLRYSYSHDSKVGHLVKSRAAENFITYNRLSSETGSSSYELDLPNLGWSLVLGNVIQQGEQSENPSLLSYGLEGTAPGNPKHELYVVNNTFVNDRSKGGTFVNVGAAVDVPVRLQNNVFAGPGTVINQTTALSVSNLSGEDPRFVARTEFDYGLLSNSPCIDSGSDPGMEAGLKLAPEFEYQHPSNGRPRARVGQLDVGAFEFGTSPQAGTGGTAAHAGASGSAGSEAQVSGSPQVSGGARNDAGSAGESGGSGPPAADDGCGCRVSGGASHGKGWLALVSAAALLGRRRRLRRRPARDDCPQSRDSCAGGRGNPSAKPIV